MAGTWWGPWDKGHVLRCVPEAGPGQGNVGKTPGKGWTWAMVECSGRQVYDPHVNIKWACSSLTDEGPSQRVKPKQGSGADTTAHGHRDHGRYFLPHGVHVKGMPPGVSGHISQARVLVSSHYLLPSAQLPTVHWGHHCEPQTPPGPPSQACANPPPGRQVLCLPFSELWTPFPDAVLTLKQIWGSI